MRINSSSSFSYGSLSPERDYDSTRAGRVEQRTAFERRRNAEDVIEITPPSGESSTARRRSVERVFQADASQFQRLGNDETLNRTSRNALNAYAATSQFTSTAHGGRDGELVGIDVFV